VPRSLPFLQIFFLLAACGTDVTAPPASDDSTPIYVVQGSGEFSPLAGQVVTVSGVVTGDFQDGDEDAKNDLGGFYIQEASPDENPQTSDGIFVFDRNSNSRNLRAGSTVTVVGVVEERNGETQVVASEIEVTGRSNVLPTELLLPQSATTLNDNGQVIADLERYEGMLVTLPQSLTVSDLYGLARFGEIILSQNGRLMQFTNSNKPDVVNNALHQQENILRSIILDDGNLQQNVSPARYLKQGNADSTEFSLRVGDEVSNLTGVIRYGRASANSGSQAYRLVPVTEPRFSSVNKRPGPPDVGGEVRVMSFNALDYFTTIDGGQDNCGPTHDLGCRGADSVEEYDRQRARTVHTILSSEAHVVGLMEVENNPRASLQSIVDGMNERIGTDNWSFIDTGVVGTDAIRVALIYDSSIVSPIGDFALLDSAIDPRFLDTKNRQALAQTFSSIANDGRFTVAVNHLKSKGSDCDAIGDPDLGDGQGNCNKTRTRAAAALGRWMSTDPTDSGDSDILIIGDMNAYLREDPVQTIVRSGYENVLDSVAGDKAYSFVFRGQSGALDHAFASATLVPQISGVSEWHINADEPPLLDYNLDFGRDDTLFDPASPYRASDHDPVVIGLNLIAE
jgi:predicted extracellular nuclease